MVRAFVIDQCINDPARCRADKRVNRGPAISEAHDYRILEVLITASCLRVMNETYNSRAVTCDPDNLACMSVFPMMQLLLLIAKETIRRSLVCINHHYILCIPLCSHRTKHTATMCSRRSQTRVYKLAYGCNFLEIDYMMK